MHQPGAAVSIKYAAIPALPHIEIDIAADLENESDLAYLGKKITKLIEFGTKKIVWIFTKSRQVLVVTDAANLQWHNRDETLQLINEACFNIADYLKNENIEVAG